MTDSDRSTDFENESELPEPELVREFWDFLRFNKRWWLTPIVIILLLAGFFIYLSGSALAPLLYPL